jgi:methylmalonyl-CoA epimerase
VFERYTEKARRVIFFARYEASMFGAPAIEAEHILLGVARDDRGLCLRFFPAGLSMDGLRRRIEQSTPPREKISTSVELPLSEDVRRVMIHAQEESDRLGHRHIGTEHLLLGLLTVEGTLAERVLRENGLEASRVREAVAADAGTGDLGAVVSSEGLSVEKTLADIKALLEGTRGGSPKSMEIAHIGIATPRIEDALKFWRDALGLRVAHTEEVAEQGVRVAMLPLGGPNVELLEPTGPDSPVAKFLEKRGPGIHHIAVRVPDIRAALARLGTGGARLIDETPRVGAGGCLVAFVHPSSAGGVLLELVEGGEDSGGSEHERS